MKKGKMFQSKCLTWMMILVMFFSMTPITAFAAEDQEPNNTVVYTGEMEENTNTVSQGDSKIAENTVTPGDATATGEESESNKKEISDEVKTLQERINALPTGEEYREMTADEQDAVYEKAAEIADAYASLSEEEQEKVDITRLEELFAVMNEGVATYSTGTAVTFLNSGYPYGRDMNSSTITLVIEVDGAAASYQWQVADSKDGTFADIAGATGSTYTFAPTNGKWYRCVVDGTASEAVMAVYPNQDGRTWTQSHKKYSTKYWYIGNGSMAYVVDGTMFDVTGLYTKKGTDYMLQTSYAAYWELFSSTSATPSAGDRTAASLDALRVSFDAQDDYNIYFEADLADGHQAFSFGCDTQLGNSSTSGYYYDSAALNAMVKNGVLQQVAMIGAQTVEAAADSDPAFVIAPVSPASRFWIGNFSSRKTYAYNTSGGTGTEIIDGQSVVTLVENTDSGMTMSWMNIPSGGSVKFRFSVGDVAHTGAVSGKVDYEKEVLTGLEAGVTYTITIKSGESSETYNITADGNGEIPLTGTDKAGKSYDFAGKSLTIAKKDSEDTPAEIEVAGRPDTPDKPSDLEGGESGTTTPSVDANIEIVELTPDSVIIAPKAGQQYAYSADGGASWTTLTAANTDASGNYVINGLQEGASVSIRTRVPATSDKPASLWSASTVVRLKSTVKASATGWSGSYDGDSHGITVSVTSPVEGATVTYSRTAGDSYDAVNPVFRAAGEYTVYYRVTAEDYYPAYGSATVTINPRTAELSWGESAFTYNGTEQAPQATVNNPVSGDSCTVTVTGGMTDANGKAGVVTYTATAAALSNPNYTLPTTNITKDFTIAQREVTVTWTDTQFTYDGSAHKPSASLGNVFAGDTCNVTVSGEQTEANTGGSTYTATASIDNSNYKIKNGDETGTFTITAKKLTDDMVWVSAKKGVTGVEVIVKDKTFGVEKTLTEGTDYTVAVTEEKGVYNIVITGKGNYQGSITGKVENPTWEGNIATSVVIDSSVEEVKPSLETVNETNAKDTLASIVKDSGLKAGVESGTGVDYNALLYMEMKDSGNTVTESEKQLIADKMEEIKEIPSDATVGMYLDLSLFMTYTISDTSGVLESATERITDTSDAALGLGKGYYQVVTITVPEELRPGENYIRRTYYIIRVHDDGINPSYAELLAVTQNGYVLTFQTDKFSTYAVAYSDEIIPTSVTLNTHEATINTEGGTISLSAAVAPVNAANKKVIWISDNPTVATVDENGKVTAVGNGTCVITGKTEDGGLTDTCVIKVDISEEDDSQDSINRPVTSHENKGNDTQVPRTGDDSNLALWIALLLLATVVLVGVTVKRRKDRGPEEK